MHYNAEVTELSPINVNTEQVGIIDSQFLKGCSTNPQIAMIYKVILFVYKVFLFFGF